MEKYRIYEIENKELDNEAMLLQETLFHNANGYIGVRGCLEEGYPNNYSTIRGAYINGFYDTIKMNQAEKLYGLVEEKQTMVNVVDTQTIYLFVNGEKFSLFQGTVLSRKRYLNMDEGYTSREIVWRSPKGDEVEVVIRRMTSFALQSLFFIEYQVKALNFSGDVKFESIHNGKVRNYSNPEDPRVASESMEHLRANLCNIECETSFIEMSTAASKLMVCTAVEHQISKESKKKFEVKDNEVIAKFDIKIKKGEGVTLTKYTIFADSIRNENCIEKAKKDLSEALSKGTYYFYKEQKRYLKNFWCKSALDIDGDDELSRAVNYNMYQLVQSVSKDKYGNIAAKGLSGEGYEGHFFWDTEMYIQPFFVLTNPEISKNLIAYRYETLNEARKNARILGHKKGVLFPWRTIMGKECSGYFPSGTAQYHINGDVAYATVAYYLATKDLDFIAEKGAEIIMETARLWMDLGNYYKERFELHTVTGPDEYTCMVDNNYFTNASAQYNLHWAVKFYWILKEKNLIDILAKKLNLTKDEIEEFEKAEKNMYLPFDKELGINPQDDSFLSKKIWNIADTPKSEFPLLLHYHPLCLYRYQVCKQADTVLSHFIYEDAQSLETIRKSFAYYEKITTHDSSLSTCIFSIVASKLGLTEKAYEYFGDSAKLDLFNTHQNTKDGIHTANMGGNYMAIVYGFGGIRLKENGLYLNPALPKKWKKYQFEILYEGSQIQVRVEKTKVSLCTQNDVPVIVFVYGNKYVLECGKEVRYEI